MIPMLLVSYHFHFIMILVVVCWNLFISHLFWPLFVIVVVYCSIVLAFVIVIVIVLAFVIVFLLLLLFVCYCNALNY